MSSLGELHPMAFLFISSVIADDIFLNLPAIASSRHTDLTGPTETFVARCATGIAMSMFTTRHDFVADLATAPATGIVSLRATLRDLMLATEAHLGRSHM